MRMMWLHSNIPQYSEIDNMKARKTRRKSITDSHLSHTLMLTVSVRPTSFSIVGRVKFRKTPDKFRWATDMNGGIIF